MRKRCKNCMQLYVFQRNSWCTRHLKHTNVDGCCGEYKRKRVNATVVALVLAAIAFMLSTLRLWLLIK